MPTDRYVAFLRSRNLRRKQEIRKLIKEHIRDRELIGRLSNEVRQLRQKTAADSALVNTLGEYPCEICHSIGDELIRCRSCLLMADPSCIRICKHCREVICTVCECSCDTCAAEACLKCSREGNRFCGKCLEMECLECHNDSRPASSKLTYCVVCSENVCFKCWPIAHPHTE